MTPPPLALRRPARMTFTSSASRRQFRRSLRRDGALYRQQSGPRLRINAMRLPAAALLILVLAATPMDARSRAVRRPGAIPSPRSVLWIGAHPDDEVVVAPLFYKWCVDDAARCRMLVLTRGEAGACVLPQGCSPDLGSVRSAEAGAASELFQAESVLLRYADGGGLLPPHWREPGPGQADTPAARIAREIAGFDPELILTFDPRHGSTCHPDHREVGRLVLEATEGLTVKPAVYLLETFLEISPDGSRVQFQEASSSALRFDGGHKLFSGADAWSALTWNMQRHPSQFREALIAAVQSTPAEQRSVFIAPAYQMLKEPVRTCP